MSEPSLLPQPTAKQPVIQLRQLPGGIIHLPLWMFVDGEEDKSKKQPCPSMSWLLHHAPSNTNLVFDLGLPKDISCLTPAVQDRLRNFVTIEVEEDVLDGLEAAGLDPTKDVDTVIFSHLHYDHIGNPKAFGPTCKYTIGPTATTILTGPDSYPTKLSSHFDSNLLPPSLTTELPQATNTSFWKPLGPFPAAHDYFNDASLFLINAPGHLPGHINLLVRYEVEKWILLAGDSCHDVRILRGEKETSVYCDADSGDLRCAHADKQGAERHLERIRQLEGSGVEVVLAHDWAWDEKNKGRFVWTA